MSTAIQITIITVALLILGINYIVSYLIKRNLNSRHISTAYHLFQNCDCALKIDSQDDIVFHIHDKTHSNVVSSNPAFENCFKRELDGKLTATLKDLTKALMINTEELKKDTKKIQESTRNLEKTVKEWQFGLDTTFDPRKTILASRKYGRTKLPFDNNRVVILAEGIKKTYRWEEGRGWVKDILYKPSPLRLVTGSEDEKEWGTLGSQSSEESG